MPGKDEEMGECAARVFAVAPPMPLLETPVMRIAFSLIEGENVAVTVEASVRMWNSG